MRLSTAADRWRDKITAAIASIRAEGSGALRATKLPVQDQEG